MKPNSAKYNPDPAYLRELLRAAGLTQEHAAKLIGISPRAMRCYVSASAADKQPAPYCVQYALERLADPDLSQILPDISNARMMIAAIIKSYGGSIRILRSAIAAINPQDILHRWEDLSGDVVLTLERPRPLPPEGETAQ